MEGREIVQFRHDTLLDEIDPARKRVRNVDRYDDIPAKKHPEGQEPKVSRRIVGKTLKDTNEHPLMLSIWLTESSG
jgi:hypothetical protein